MLVAFCHKIGIIFRGGPRTLFCANIRLSIAPLLAILVVAALELLAGRREGCLAPLDPTIG